MPRCPGQDQRFWKPDDIFEAECPHCGSSIEFWKDEPSLRCPQCKNLVVNPKLDLGCATWCQHAEQCLGTLSDLDDILCKRLIREAKEHFGRDERRVDRTLRIFRNAQEIMTVEEFVSFFIGKLCHAFSKNNRLMGYSRAAQCFPPRRSAHQRPVSKRWPPRSLPYRRW